MANLLILKRRIRTAQNVSKTTRAMQMIAASKLKKAQEATLSSRPYTDSITSLVKRALSKTEDETISSYLKAGEDKNTLFVLISPDKGLCGGLVTNLARESFIQSPTKNNQFITVGKKAETIAAKTGSEIIASFLFGSNLPKFDLVYPIVKIAEEKFLKNEISSVKIIYTEFSSIFNQKPSTATLLPIEMPEEKVNDNTTIFEPDLDSIIPGLLKNYLEMRLFQALLESYLSEQAARMLAMQNATDNALEIIEELKLDYNKSRQEKITNELLDITGGVFVYE